MVQSLIGRSLVSEAISNVAKGRVKIKSFREIISPVHVVSISSIKAKKLKEQRIHEFGSNLKFETINHP